MGEPQFAETRVLVAALGVVDSEENDDGEVRKLLAAFHTGELVTLRMAVELVDRCASDEIARRRRTGRFSAGVSDG